MKKLGFIVLIAVLAIGILGVAYAGLFVGAAQVQTNVTMGDLKGTIAVSNISATPSYVVTNAQIVGNNSDAVTVTISNAAPGAVITVPFTITNTGSIPAGSVMIGPATGWTTELAVTGNTGSAGPLENGHTYGGTWTITVGDTVSQDGTYYVTIPVTLNQ
jgi:hypothetical protein